VRRFPDDSSIVPSGPLKADAGVDELERTATRGRLERAPVRELGSVSRKTGKS